jgi:hypothetical protein
MSHVNGTNIHDGVCLIVEILNDNSFHDFGFGERHRHPTQTPNKAGERERVCLYSRRSFFWFAVGFSIIKN